MPAITADFLRQRYPKLKDASDAEIAQLAHQAFAPDTDYRQFEDQFLGKSSVAQELGRGVVRGARALKGGLDFLAGGVASLAGDTEGADKAFASYEQNMAANRRLGARRGVTQVRSLSDAADVAAGYAGEALPMLVSAPLGAGAVAAAGGLSSAANAPQRVDQLMSEDTSVGRKALATGALTVLGGAADAFVPARIAAGAAARGLRGAATDVALNTGIGAATPLAERAAAAALDKDGTATFTRGGAEQIGEELLAGGAAGGVTAGIARPVIAGANRLARPVQDGARGAFSRFQRTQTGEVDLTTRVQSELTDTRPAYQRAGRESPFDRPASVAGLAGDMPPRSEPDFTSLATGRGEADPLAVMRGELPVEPTGVARGVRRAADTAVDPLEAMSAQVETRSQDGVDMNDPRLSGAQLDLFDGPTSTLPTRAPAEAATPVTGVRRTARQLPLEFGQQGDGVVYVDRGGQPVDPAVATADPAVVAAAERTQAAARMAQARPGQTPDMFGGPPRSAEGPAPAPPQAQPPVDTPAGQRLIDPSLLTTTDLLRELEAASKDTGVKAFHRGEPAGGKSKFGLKSILDAKDPVAAIREAYQNGAHDKAELLDAWHERLTGQKLSKPAAPVPQATTQAATPADAPAGVPPKTEGEQLGRKFAADEDLPGRVERGMLELQAQLDRAKKMLAAAKNAPERLRAEEHIAFVEDNIQEFRATFKRPRGKSPSNVAMLERNIAMTRAWEDRIAGKGEATGFAPSRDPNRPLGQRDTSGREGLTSEAPNPDFAQDKTVEQALTRVASTGSEFERTLAERLIPVMGQAKFTVVEDGVRVPGGVPLLLNVARGVQLTDKSKGMDGVWVRGATFSDQGVNNRTVLHEALHQATARKISLGNMRVSEGSALNRAVSDLYDLANHVIKTAKADIAAGRMSPEMRKLAANALNDPRELVSYGMTEPEVQSYLKSVPGVSRRTAWSDFVDRVRGLFGLDKKHTSALADLMDITDRLIDADLPPATREYEAQLVARGQTQSTPDAMRQERDLALAEDGSPAALSRVAGAGIERNAKTLVQDAVTNTDFTVFRKGLSLMTTEQIVEQWGSQVKGARQLLDAMQRKFSAEYGAMTQADTVLKKMLALDKSSRDRLADLMFAATEAEIHPDQPLSKSRKDPTEGEVNAHALLAAKYQALPADAKEVYRASRKVLEDQFTDVTTALRRLVARVEPDPEARAERLRQVNELIGKVRGPYFPLARFGDYVTVAKGAAADGRSIVQHFESPAEQQRGREELIRQGVSPDRIVMTMRDDQRFQQEVSSTFVEGVRSAIDRSIEDPDQRAAMSAALNELIIRSLPAASGAKNFIRRRNVEGYSADAARALADSVVRAGRYVSNLNFTPDMNAAVISLQPYHAGNAEKMPVHVMLYERDGARHAEVFATAAERLQAQDRLLADGVETNTVRATLEALPRELAAFGLSDEQAAPLLQLAKQTRDQALAGGDVRRTQEVANHLRMKAAAMVGPTSESAVFQALGRLAHIKYLGLSPAYWLTNLAQVPTMSFPHLSGRYGVAQTATALGRAMPAASRAFKLMADHLTTGRGGALDLADVPGVSKLEHEALQFLADRGQLDITQTSDLGHIARGQSTVGRTAVEYITAGAHYTEIFNRMVTGLAAYRLAIQSGTPHQAAMRQALQDVSATQFNYAEYNKPAVMQARGPLGAPARLVFMFQQYAQNTLYWWARNIQKAAGGDRQARVEAARAMGLAAAGLSIMGGVAGLPLMGTAHMLSNLVAQLFTDDPGFDSERELEEALKGMGADDRTARVLLRGVFTMAGTDLSERLGQGDLLSKLGLTERQQQRRELERNPELQFFMDLLGPVASMAGDVPKAIKAAQDGDMAKLFELVPVKGLADVARAVNFSQQGVRSASGDILLGADELSAADISLKAAGFQPQPVQDMYRDRGQLRLIEARVAETRSKIIRGFARGLMAGDDSLIDEALTGMQRYNESVQDRYPQLTMTGQQLSEGVRRLITEQAMLGLTGGRAKNPRALTLALQLNPGMHFGATPQPSEAEPAGN